MIFKKKRTGSPKPFKATPKPEHVTALAQYVADHAPEGWKVGYVFAHYDKKSGATDIKAEYDQADGTKAFSKTMTTEFVGLVVQIREDFLDNKMTGWTEMQLTLANDGELAVDFKYS